MCQQIIKHFDVAHGHGNILPKFDWSGCPSLSAKKFPAR